MTAVMEAPHTAPTSPQVAGDTVRALEPRIAELCGQLNATYAQLVDVIAEAAASGAWQGAGIRSLAHWVTWKCGISDPHARQLVAIAEGRSSHPKVAAVFDDGLVSVDQAAIAVRCDPVDDDDFAHAATVMTIPQLRLFLRASQPAEPAPPPGNDPPTPAPAPAPEEPAESVLMFHDRYGQWRADVRLDADRGQLVRTALQEARDRLFHDGNTDVTWADALVDIAQRSLDNLPLARRERFRINVFIDPAKNATATWINGIAIPDAIRDLLLCDGTINPTYTANAHPVNVGRSQRIVPERTRRLIEHRDMKCRVPWCARETGLQIHHLVEWIHDGPTDTWNLIAICEHCHRQHHKGLLGITGNADRPDGLIFTDQHGQIIDFAAHPHKPSRPAPTPKQPYRHPDGGRMQASAIMFHPHRRQWPPGHHHRHMPGYRQPDRDGDSDDGQPSAG